VVSAESPRFWEIKLASVLHHAASESVTHRNGDLDSTALQRRKDSRGHKRAIIRADKPELFPYRREEEPTQAPPGRTSGVPGTSTATGGERRGGGGGMEGSGSRGGRWRSADRNFWGSMGTVGEGTERSGG